MDTSSILNVSQTVVPLLGGFGVLIWLIWRLFWKVDRRSQMELSSKDREIATITADRDKERTLRFASDERANEANERASRAESRESALEARLQDFTDQIDELRKEIARLRLQINTQNPSTS